MKKIKNIDIIRRNLMQINLFKNIANEIKKIDILNITPIEAINILSKLKEKVK